MIKKNIYIILPLILTISSCETPLPLYKLIYDTGIEFRGNIRDNQIPKKTLDNIEFAFIRASIGLGSPKSILVLARENNGILEWVSESSEKIYTLNGKIIKTEGLPNDIEILTFDNFNSFPHFTETTSLVNFYNPALHYQNQRISLKKKGLSKINNHIEGFEDIPVQIYEEKISMNKIYWSVKNKYYYNVVNGYLERTVQTIHPDLPPITIEFIRKYK
ncbi:YjbF family lipoprotein [Gammaproteobacteria bacterium]|nr:YjbF family lipoprotein [Gammaproteobacteria bacterium]